MDSDKLAEQTAIPVSSHYHDMEATQVSIRDSATSSGSSQEQSSFSIKNKIKKRIAYTLLGTAIILVGLSYVVQYTRPRGTVQMHQDSIPKSTLTNDDAVNLKSTWLDKDHDQVGMKSELNDNVEATHHEGSHIQPGYMRDKEGNVVPDPNTAIGLGILRAQIERDRARLLELMRKNGLQPKVNERLENIDSIKHAMVTVPKGFIVDGKGSVVPDPNTGIGMANLQAQIKDGMADAFQKMRQDLMSRIEEQQRKAQEEQRRTQEEQRRTQDELRRAQAELREASAKHLNPVQLNVHAPALGEYGNRQYMPSISQQVLGAGHDSDQGDGEGESNTGDTPASFGQEHDIGGVVGSSNTEQNPGLGNGAMDTSSSNSYDVQQPLKTIADFHSAGEHVAVHGILPHVHESKEHLAQIHDSLPDGSYLKHIIKLNLKGNHK